MPKGINNIDKTKYIKDRSEELHSDFYKKLKNDLLFNELHDKKDDMTVEEDYLSILLNNPRIRRYSIRDDARKRNEARKINRGKYYDLIDNIY